MKLLSKIGTRHSWNGRYQKSLSIIHILNLKKRPCGNRKGGPQIHNYGSSEDHKFVLLRGMYIIQLEGDYYIGCMIPYPDSLWS